MSGRSVLFLVIIVAAISAGATYFLFGGDENTESASEDEAAQVAASNPQDEPRERLVTFERVITATPDPNVIMVTVTPNGDTTTNPTPVTGEDGAEVTPEAPAASEAQQARAGTADSLDTSLIDETGRYIGDESQLPSGCVLHTVADGEFPTLIIESYDLPAEATFTMMTMNGLSEETATQIQIGDQLVVPLEDCPVEAFLEAQPDGTVAEATEEATAETTTDDAEATEEATAEATPDVTATPTIQPTATLAPTVEGSTVEIASIIRAGELESEGIEIINNGNTVDISNWTLSDGDGNTFVFPPERRLFDGASITVLTTEGDNTAILLYWGLDEAVFEPGDVVVLADASGNVQSSLRIP
jgi:hypothetical protein